MKSGAPLSKPAILASVILGVVILSVFYVLQDYGPESAIRRFHRAVQVRDAGELQRVTEQSLDKPSVRNLIGFVTEMDRVGAHYRLLKIDRGSKEAYAALEYVAPNGETYATVWIVVRPKALWRVDAERTFRVLEDRL